jgi:FG-GAP repeat
MAGGAWSSWGLIATVPGWNVVDVGDINGDGFADIVTQNSTTGQIQYANMANGVFSGWVSVTTASGFTASSSTQSGASLIPASSSNFNSMLSGENQSFSGTGNIEPKVDGQHSNWLMDGAQPGWSEPSVGDHQSLSGRAVGSVLPVFTADNGLKY